MRSYIGSSLIGQKSIPEHCCSEDNKDSVDHYDHLPIGISKLSGPTKVGTLVEHHYFRSGEAEVKVLMKYQSIE